MLVLSRKVGQKIFVGDDVTITLVRISGDKARIGVEAPKNVPILREEVKKRQEAEVRSSGQRE